MFPVGQDRPIPLVRATSALPPISTAQRTFGDGRKVPQAVIPASAIRRIDYLAPNAFWSGIVYGQCGLGHGLGVERLRRQELVDLLRGARFAEKVSLSFGATLTSQVIELFACLDTFSRYFHPETIS
jgi:hypothetical protein